MIKLIFILLISFFSFLFCHQSCAQREQELKEKHVLVLSSYNRSEHINSLIFDSLEKKLEKKGNIDLIVDILTINYFEKWEPLEDQITIFLKSKSIVFDLCIVIGRPATNFFKKHRNEILGPSTPTIYIGERLESEKGIDNTFYLNFDFNLTETLKMARLISNKTIIIYDTLPTYEHDDDNDYHLKFRNKSWLIENIEEIIKVKNDGDKFVIIYKSALETEIGIGYSDNQHAILNLHRYFPDIPIIIIFDYILIDTSYDFKDVILGGYVIDNDDIINKLIDIIGDIEKNPNQIKFYSLENKKLKINYTFLNRYPILKNLSDITVLNNPYSWIKENKLLVGFISFLIVVILVISFLFIKNRSYTVKIREQNLEYQFLLNNINLIILEVDLREFYEEVKKGKNDNSLINLIHINNINRYGRLYFSCHNPEIVNISSWLGLKEEKKVIEELVRSIHNETSFSIEVCVKSLLDSSRQYTFLLNGPRFNEKLFLTKIPFNLIDITERSQREIKLLLKTERDYLTGVLSKESFLEKTRDMLKSYRKNDSSKNIDIIFIDLDKFKPVNDTYGHDIGDLLLQSVCARISNQIRKSDYFGRIGGDEFCISLETNDAKDTSRYIAHKIIEQLNKPFQIEGNNIIIGCSIGIARLDETVQNIEDLIKRADRAMYQSKKNGGSSFTFWHSSIEDSND